MELQFLFLLFSLFNVVCVHDSHASKIDIPEKKEVIVVGGGMAGMAAARRLLRAGNINVRVLEARKDMYGGRIKTYRKAAKGVKGVDVELGANFINTVAKNNALVELVDKFELKYAHAGDLQVYHFENDVVKVLDGDNANNIYFEAFKIVIKALNKAKNETLDKPVADVVKEELSNTNFEDGNISNFDRQLIKLIINSLVPIVLKNFSAHHYDVHQEFGWDKVIIDGMDALLDRIVSGDPNELPIKIDLNKIVRNIAVDNERNKVLVRTVDRKQLIADAVVVAVPLGILKSGAVIFEPRLSSAWYKAIDKLGIGYSSKVIVGFDEAFWPRDVGIFTVFSDIARDGFLQMWTNSYRLSGNPFLIGTILGDKAKEWEAKPLEELKKLVTTVLGQMFGDQVVASHKLTTFVHSNWSTDENILGSRSYPVAGSSPEIWAVLQKPVCPYIYFAGSYTEAVTQVDSLHDAYNSGIKAAEQIILNACNVQGKDRKDQSGSKKKSEKDKSSSKHKKDKDAETSDNKQKKDKDKSESKNKKSESEKDKNKEKEKSGSKEKKDENKRKKDEDKRKKDEDKHKKDDSKLKNKKLKKDEL